VFQGDYAKWPVNSEIIGVGRAIFNPIDAVEKESFRDWKRDVRQVAMPCLRQLYFGGEVFPHSLILLPAVSVGRQYLADSILSGGKVLPDYGLISSASPG
jgi:hypothetical protein